MRHKFQELFRRHLKKRDLSQERLARKLHVSASEISKFVNGWKEYPLPLLEATIKIFGIENFPEQVRELLEVYEDFWNLQLQNRDMSAALADAIQRDESLSSDAKEQTAFDLPPSPIESFFGYQKKIERAIRLIATYRSPVWVEGLEGVGKTEFLAQVIDRISKATRNGKPQFEAPIWIDVNDKRRDTDWFEYILNAVAGRYRELGLTKRPSNFEQEEQKQDRILELLQVKPTLLVIDNYHLASNPELDSWLCKVQRPSVVVVSSVPPQDRRKMLRNASLVELMGLIEDMVGINFLRFHAELLDLQKPELADDYTLEVLVDKLDGHPMALLQALSDVKYGGVALSDAHKFVSKGHIDWEPRWSYLDPTPHARDVWMVMSFFDRRATRGALSATVSMVDIQLHEAIRQLVRLHILNVDEASDAISPQYFVHGLARAFAEDKLKEHPTFAEEARKNWAEFYIKMASDSTLRGPEEQRYWSSLGNFRLEPIASEWRNFEQVLIWADENEKNEVVLKLVLMLVHHMDKLLLFNLRLKYGSLAADAAHQEGQKENEAWLRIDALGWTYMETGASLEAEMEIKKGKVLAEALYEETLSLNGNDPKRQVADNQLGLAYAFLARVYLKRGSDKDLRTAVRYHRECVKRTPRDDYWLIIQSRIDDVGGEIASAQGNLTRARKLFEKANATSQRVEVGGSHDLAEVYLTQGKYKEAKMACNAVIRAYKFDATIEVIQAYFMLARIAQSQLEQGVDEHDNPCEWAQKAYYWLSRMNPDHQLMKKVVEFLNLHCAAIHTS